MIKSVFCFPISNADNMLCWIWFVDRAWPLRVNPITPFETLRASFFIVFSAYAILALMNLSSLVGQWSFLYEQSMMNVTSTFSGSCLIDSSTADTYVFWAGCAAEAGALQLQYLASAILCKWMTDTLYLDYLDSMYQIEIYPKTEMLKKPWPLHLNWFIRGFRDSSNTM